MSYTPPADTNPVSLGNVTHFLGNAVNAAAFNAGDLIPGVKPWLEDEQYKGAHDVGTGAGLVGSMFIPGGVLAKGAGLGAKALGAGKLASGLEKASQFMSGAGKTDLATNLLRGAALGAEQAVPRALVAMTPQGGGESIQDAATQAALGAGLGAGIGGVGGAITKGAKKLFGSGKPGEGGMLPDDLGQAAQEATARQVIAGTTGGSARAVRQWADQLKGYGPFGQGEKIDQGLQDLVDFQKKHNLYNNENLKTYQEGLGEVFDAAQNAMNRENTPFFKAVDPEKIKSGEENAIPDWLASNPAYKGLKVSMSGYTKGEQSADDLIGAKMQQLQKQFDTAEDAGLKGMNAVMDRLNKDEQFAINNPNVDARVEAMMSGTIKDALQEHGFDIAKALPETQPLLDKLSLKGMDEAKQAYRTLGPWRWINKLQASKTEPFMTAGSDTATKMAIQGMLGNAGALAAGGALGAGAGGWDPSNPMTYVGAIGGAALGNPIAKGVNAIGNGMMAQEALKANQALKDPNSLLSKGLTGIQNLARGNGPAPVKNIPMVPGAVIQPNAPVGSAEQSPDNGWHAPMVAPQLESLSQPAMPPGALGGRTYENTVNGVVDRLYRQTFLNNGEMPRPGDPTKQEFAKQLYDASNGFDPIKMAKVLIPGDEKGQDDFIRSVQKMKALAGVNVERDLISKALPTLGGVLDPVQYGYALDKLAINLAQPESGGQYDQKRMVLIRNQIDGIIKGWGSPQQKQDLVNSVIRQNSGVNTQMLNQFGLTEGTMFEGL